MCFHTNSIHNVETLPKEVTVCTISNTFAMTNATIPSCYGTTVTPIDLA
jgi:hypothetical protein